MELDPELLKLLVHSPWLLLLVLIFWPEKGIIALWIKSRRDIKLAEMKRDKASNEVQERAAKRLTQEPALLEAPKGEENGDVR